MTPEEIFKTEVAREMIESDPDLQKHKPLMEAIGKARAAANAQDQSLQDSDIPNELKMKIRNKFIELARKHPHMKRDRMLRKAGEFYKVKFTFE